MKKLFASVTVGFALFLAAPADSLVVGGDGGGETVCYYCKYPPVGQTGPGICARHGDGYYEDCENKAWGCEFDPFTSCDGDGQLTRVFRSENLDLGFGLETQGMMVAEGAFAMRECDGIQTGVVYSAAGLAERQQLAEVITLSAE